MPGFRWIIVVLAMLALSTAATVAQPVGTVAEFDSHAACTNCNESIDHNFPIRVGNNLVTNADGRLFVNFDDRSLLKLYQNSQLMVQRSAQTPEGFSTQCILEEGHVQVYVRKTSKFEVLTAAGVVRSHSTDFFVFYDPTSETAEVIGVEGEVEVFGVEQCAGRKVAVSSHELTTVVRGHCPAPPSPVDDATLRSYVEAGELIGKGAVETLGLDGIAITDESRPPLRPPFSTDGAKSAGCTTPADCVKPPFVPPGNVVVQY